jgi:sugar lactone lactonase YvrE
LLSEVTFIGSGLKRPECVLATRRGDLYAADWRGGVSHIRPDGTQALFIGQTADIPEGLRPNGIALEADGSFLLANLGTDVGGVWRLTRDGQVSPVLVELDGHPLPPSNFCVRDDRGRLWLTVSTRLKPRALDYRKGAASGFIVLMDETGARIVADGIGFTNEALIDPTGQWLYVNETYARRLSRYPLRANGDCGPKEVIATFGRGQFPDGFAFDVEGNVYTTMIVANQLVKIARDGAVTVLLDGGDPTHVDTFESAWQSDSLDYPHMATCGVSPLKNISNIAFGGPDLQTAYLGCLLGDRIATLRMPVEGLKPVHWTY